MSNKLQNTNINSYKYKKNKENSFKSFNKKNPNPFLKEEIIKPKNEDIYFTKKGEAKNNVDIKIEGSTIYHFAKRKKILLEDHPVSLVRYANFNGSTDIAKSYLKNKRDQKPFSRIISLFYFYDDDDYYSKTCLEYDFIDAATNGYIYILKLFLKDPRIIANYNNNYVLKISYKNGYSDIVKLLWKHSQVRSLLKEDDIKLYQTLKIKHNINKF
jgi:hypothetical protein